MTTPRPHGFLEDPEPSPEVQRIYDADRDDGGYVMNLSYVWAQLPGSQDALADLTGLAARTAGLTLRQRGVLVAAAASALGDSYCSLAWGGKLADVAGPAVAAAVIHGTDEGLEPGERVLAAWARQLARDPRATMQEQVAALREAGYDDRQVFAVTLFVALRLAFSTVNDALGALPDRELVDAAAPEVRDAVRFGRPPAPSDT